MSPFDPGQRRAPSVPSFTHEDNGVTFLIVSGAGSAAWTPERIQVELALGRRVNVIATPTAASWLDPQAIRDLTGWDLRCEQRGPLTPTFEPPGCRVLASPVTLNTLTKWAKGWESRGWRRKEGEIANLELVQAAWALLQQRPNVRLEWIRAHDGSRWNEYADALSTAHLRSEA